MWELAETANADAMNCNIGERALQERHQVQDDPVPVSAGRRSQDQGRRDSSVAAAVEGACNKVDPKCTETWNATVGKARGFKIH